jgi:hypothetical protein
LDVAIQGGHVLGVQWLEIIIAMLPLSY